MDLTARLSRTESAVAATGDATPWELRDGRWYKREDAYRLPSGVNGAKLRACHYLISGAAAAGYTRVVSASSVLSPQAAMAAVWAQHFGMGCTIVVGGTTPSKAVRHPSVRTAWEHEASLHCIGVGYNPALQRAARGLVAADENAWLLPYGITTPPGAGPAEVAAFLGVGAQQVLNMPPSVRTLVVPFGSGNTAAGVLTGLASLRSVGRPVPDVVLVGIGPDRRTWLAERLLRAGVVCPPYEHLDLHGTGYATYSDRMPGTADGITLHPTYEGKVVRYLNERKPDWWVRRDGTTALWIVGGPL